MNDQLNYKENFMNTNTINCPECSTEISVEKILEDKLRESVKKEYEEKLQKQAKATAEKEAALAEREAQIIDSEKQIQKKVQEQLEAKSKESEAQLRTSIQEEYAVVMKAKDDALKEKQEQLSEANQRELELIQKEQKLNEEKESLTLEVARKVAEEREELITKAKKQITEEHQLKDLEKQKVIKDLQVEIENLKQRAEQGSMQIQGEVQELSIEDTLNTAFPIDDFEPVPTGTEGADVLQKVKNQSLQTTGRILWESKNTKTWGGTWIKKLKDDQIEARADIAVLVTKTMPKEFGDKDFGQLDGVWIISRSMVVPVAILLRTGVLQVAIVRNFNDGMEERMQVLHGFLTGPDFRNKMEAIIQTFGDMQKELEKEKRAYKTKWKRNQKNIDRVIDNVAGMWGDFQGILGNELGTISALELEDPEPSLLLEEVQEKKVEQEIEMPA